MVEPEETFGFEAELWLYASAKAAWHFVTVPADISHSIRFLAGGGKGFGSVRVRARLGATSWSTSLFPDKKSGCYFLPMKADVRRTEKVTTGDKVSIELTMG